MIVPHPSTWIELNQIAFNHNINIYRSFIGTSLLAVVVKSNAYGHGLKEIGSFCQQHSEVDWLCTSSLSEALELRSQGISKPILVLSIIDQDPLLAITYNIDLPVFDLETAHKINNLAKSIRAFCSVHIKIDTGIARFGFLPEEAISSLVHISNFSNLKIRGIYTHCGESGNPDKEYTMHQLHQFNKIIKNLYDLNIEIPLRHASNSAAASTINQNFPLLNFVRIGAGAYGLWHFRDSWQESSIHHPGLTLKPILTWKSRITQLRQVPEKTFISYDRTYQTSRASTLAIVPLGYHEGYDRRLSNKGTILINNSFYAPVVGRIGMNATILEIPADKAAFLGDEAILIGDHDQIRAHDIAQTIGSFNAREITTRLSSAIKRNIVTSDQSIIHNDAKKISSDYKSKGICGNNISNIP